MLTAITIGPGDDLINSVPREPDIGEWFGRDALDAGSFEVGPHRCLEVALQFEPRMEDCGEECRLASNPARGDVVREHRRRALRRYTEAADFRVLA
jgi:hypothetical protein